MILTARTTRRTSKNGAKRKGKPRPNRVGIPLDPVEYEARRINAQRAVDRYHGPGRYRVIGEPGEMLHLVNWVDYPLLTQTAGHTNVRSLKKIEQRPSKSHAA
jgi:hypothetical protein